MSDATPRLGLDYVLANQAQKHVTVNTDLWRLDGLIQMRLESRAVSAPPGSPAHGATWLMPAGGGTGGWSGFAGGALARRDGGVWTAMTAPVGTLAYVADEGEAVVLTADGWRSLGQTLKAVGPLTRLGVGSAPDPATPLVVRGPASLFDADAGGDHRLTLNRTTAAKTASVVFQTAYHGEAEIGLCGAGGLAVRTSTDGVTWRTLLSTDPAGRLGVNTTTPEGVLHIVGENAAIPTFQMTAASASSAGCNFTGLKTRGTAAAPTAALSGDRLLAFYGKGWTSAGATGGNAVAIQMSASENFTASAQGSTVTFETTPLGSTTRRVIVSFQPNGSLRLMPLTTAPTSPSAGEIYFDQTLGTFRGWTGSVWTVLG